MTPKSYIDITFYILLATVVIGLIVVAYKLKNSRRALAASKKQKFKVEQGEKRILDFLHHLGISIDQENTHHKLYKVIVEGVKDVTESTGAALYLLDPKGEKLIPSFITNRCAQLIPDPEDDDSEKRELLIKHIEIAKHDGVLGQCLLNNSPISIDSLKAHPALRDELVKYSGENAAAMLTPLTHAGRQIGVLAVTKPSVKKAYSCDELYTFSSIAEQSAFAIGNFNAHHQLAEKKRLENELKTAQEVQRVLIPEDPPEVPGFNIYGYNIPARMISGDYFDYMKVNGDKTGVIIADVSGKGIPAGIIMATFRSSLKAIATHSESPAESLSQLNKLIYPDIREDMFISAAYAHLDHITGTIKLARAGHTPPFLFRTDKCLLEKVKPPGLAVGIDTGDVFTRVIKDQEITMNKGDFLLLYTDGIIEAVNEDGEEFSADRLKKAMHDRCPNDAKTVSLSILNAVEEFVGTAPQADDITLVMIEKL